MIWILNQRLMAKAEAALRGVRHRHGFDASQVRALLEAVKAFLFGCMFLVVLDRVDPVVGPATSQLLQGALFAVGFLVLAFRLLVGRLPSGVAVGREETVLRTTFLFLCACLLMAVVDQGYVALAAFVVFVHAERLVAACASRIEA